MDLFVSLSEKDHPLQQRRLPLTSHMPTMEQRKALWEKPGQGVSATDSMPRAPELVLSRTVIGNTDLVRRESILSNN